MCNPKPTHVETLDRMTRTIILIGIGGGLGSILRYLTSFVVNKYFQSTFPYATFIVNIIGCLLIGIIIGLFERQFLMNSDLKFLFVVGFCGGYTTFSTFSAENLELLQSGNFLTAFLYITLSILICLLAVWLGIRVTKF